MITGIIGLPGHGKTLEAVRMARQAYRSGRCHVYANIPLNLPDRFTRITPETLLDARGGVCECKCPRAFVLIDEAHLWLPSRKPFALPMSWVEGFSQTRKMKWDLVWTAQSLRRVDSVLRDVTAFLIDCSAWVWPVEFYVYEHYEADRFRNPRFRLRKDVRRRSRSVSAMYDTEQQVQGAAHTKRGSDPYAPGGLQTATAHASSGAPVALSAFTFGAASAVPDSVREVVSDVMSEEFPGPSSEWSY